MISATKLAPPRIRGSPTLSCDCGYEETDGGSCYLWKQKKKKKKNLDHEDGRVACEGLVEIRAGGECGGGKCCGSQ